MLCIFFVIIFLTKQRKQKEKSPKMVEGGWPIIGHGWKFSRDVIGFIREARKKYGDYFKIKLFSKEIIVVCDRNACNEYFTSKESSMSLYDILDGLYFSNGFSDDKDFFPTIIEIVKKSVEVKFDKFAPKIMDEAYKVNERLKNIKGKINMKDEMSRFVSNTSARCFIGIELSDEFYGYLTKFSQMLNRVIVVTYLFPKWFLNVTVNLYLRYYRNKMTKLLEPVIQEYIDDLKKGIL